MIITPAQLRQLFILIPNLSDDRAICWVRGIIPFSIPNDYDTALKYVKLCIARESSYAVHPKYPNVFTRTFDSPFCIYRIFLNKGSDSFLNFTIEYNFDGSSIRYYYNKDDPLGFSFTTNTGIEGTYRNGAYEIGCMSDDDTIRSYIYVENGVIRYIPDDNHPEICRKIQMFLPTEESLCD
jgi:hypothetical protein